MTFAGRLNSSICAVIVLVTMACGGCKLSDFGVILHFTAIIVILWSLDSLISGELHFSPKSDSTSLFLIIIYGIFQIIPFWKLAETARKFSGISKTISTNLLPQNSNILLFVALLIFLIVTISLLNTNERIKSPLYS